MGNKTEFIMLNLSIENKAKVQSISWELNAYTMIRQIELANHCTTLYNPQNREYNTLQKIKLKLYVYFFFIFVE